MQRSYQRDFSPDPLADDFDQSGPCEFSDDSPHSVLATFKLTSRPARDARPQPEQPVGPISLADIPGVIRASRLEHPAVPTVSSGIAPIDSLTGGLPRGGLTEICGPASSGRTSILLSIMAAATARGELCALVDAADSFSPHAAAAAGIDLDRVLWVRCSGETSAHSSQDQPKTAATPGPETFRPVQDSLRSRQTSGSIMPAAKIWYGRPPARSERASATKHLQPSDSKFKIQNSKSGNREALAGRSRFRSHHKHHWGKRIDQALKAADLLLQSGGFGLVILDFADVPSDIARRIPLTSWFRFRRAVENTPAVLLAIARESCAGTCASLVLQTAANGAHTSTMRAENAGSDNPPHTRIFAGLNVRIEVMRSRNETSIGEKKPPRPAHAAFQSMIHWAG